MNFTRGKSVNHAIPNGNSVDTIQVIKRQDRGDVSTSVERT
jgi:hypothetical protein